MRFPLLAALLAIGSPATAIDLPDFGPPAKKFADVGTAKVEIVPAEAKRGAEVTVKLTITPKKNAWTYPTKVDKGQVGKNVLPPKSGVLVFDEAVDPKGQELKPAALGGMDSVYKAAVTWELKAWVAKDAKAGAAKIEILSGPAAVQICNKDNCFNARDADLPAADFKVLDGDPVKLSEEDEKKYQAGLARYPEPKAEKTPAGLIRKKPIPPADHEARLKGLVTATETQKVERVGGIWPLLLTAAFWGFVSLATPCVFPMIPITVSLFLKQSNQSAAGAVKLATVYSLTIVVVLGLAAVLLLSAFRELSVDPFMNVFLGGLFVFFTLSLFGMYEATIRATLWYVSVFGGFLLAVASWGVNPLPDLWSAVEWSAAAARGFFRDVRAWKWNSDPGYAQVLDALKPNWTVVSRTVSLTACAVTLSVLWRTGHSTAAGGGLLQLVEARRKQGGLVGTVFGAVMFSIVSFTCVAPFLGGFAGMASSGQYTQFELILAGLTFATAFAAPFFVLALFPSLLKKLPKSGGWLDSVKVVMGFLEIAAALKFFRTAEIRWTSPTELFTYDLVIAGWVVIAVACGLYLLNVYRLPHDEEKSHIGVPRLMFALLFLGFGLYLMPAAFKAGEENNRPRGVVFAWVDAFLLPEPGGAEFPWNSDLPDALERGRTDPEKKLVFVDFTGETCTNCKANEKAVFPKPAVKELLNRYQLASMYTDDVPAAFYLSAVPLADRKAEAKANLEFQRAVFGTEQLPLYAILEPTATGAKVLAVYPGGLIGEGDVGKFVEFLKTPLAK